MAQHDYSLINQSGANFRADLNNALAAIVSNNSGGSEPSTKFAYEFWVDETSGKMKLRNSANNAWITMPFNIGVNNSVDINVGTVNGLTSFSFNSGATVTSILDEDNFNSNSATALATQQSIKSYVDSQVDTVDSLSEILAIGNSSGGTNINLTTTDRVQFRDSAIYVFSSTDGTLDLKADGEIQLSAPYIDLAAANVNVDGTIDAVGVEFNTLSGTGSVTITDIVDEDNMGSNSPTKLATQQSIKSYVDSQVTAQDLDITDGSNTIGIDLDSETLSLLGGTGVSSSASGNGVTFAIGQPVGTGNNVVFNQVTASVVGNASSATVLQNARTISGISFNGGANITLNTSTITENTNLYYTQARFDTAFAGKSTTNLAEGNKLFFTNERVDDRVAALIQNGTGISWSYNDGSGTLTPTITLSPFNTGQLSESGNLYYTAARANSAIDSRVNKSFVDSLGIAATTAVTLLNARTISLSGDVVGSVAFNGAGNVSISTVIQANSVALTTDTTGDYIKTITGTNNKITVSGSGTEGRDVTLTLPNDVQIANNLTVANNLSVNGTLTTLNTTNLAIEDNLFELNAGLTGTPVNDSGMFINRGNQNNAVFIWDESADKFTLGLTTASGTATGNISLSALGTLVANIEGQLVGNVTGQVSSISNFTTANLTENTNLYFTNSRANSAIDSKVNKAFIDNLSVVASSASGNAGSATVLATARTIGGVAFNGSANIVPTTFNAGTFSSTLDVLGVTKLKVGGVAKLTTRAAGILVGGEVEANTLDITGVASIDGNTTIGGTLGVTGAATFNSSITIPDYVIHAGDSNTKFGFYTGDAFEVVTGNVSRLKVNNGEVNINDTGIDMNFRVESDGNANMLFVDGGTNRVGIGTSSPSTKLHVKSTSDNIVATQVSTNSVNALFQSIESASLAQIGTTGSHAFTFFTANQERARIDASGNLLVGNTDSTPYDRTSGNAISLGDGLISSAQSGGNAAIFNRMTNDGSVVGFRKAGSAVGSIGTQGGDLNIGTAACGIAFVDGVPAIYPWNTSSNATRDAAIDLGDSGARFKDLYLSGQTQITGGAVSAPSYSFIGDTDTGISRPTTNALNFVTAGSERVRVDANGKIHINESVGRAQLNLSLGNVTGVGQFASSQLNLSNPTNVNSISQITFGYDATGRDNAAAYMGYLSTVATTNGKGALVFGTRDDGNDTQPTERMRVTSAGNVGIGTSSPAYITEIAKSQAGGVGATLYLHNTADNSGVGHAAEIRFNLRNAEATTRNAAIQAIAEGTYGTSPALTFLTSSGDNGSATERVRITSAGFLGIGLTNPARALSTKSSSVTVGTFESTSASGSLISFVDPNTTNDVTVRVGSQANALVLQTGGVERVRILADGKTGIGTASPATLLHLKAASGEAELRLEAANNSEARLRFGDATDNDAAYVGYSRSGGFMNFSALNTDGVHMRIASNGTTLFGVTAEPSGSVGGSGFIKDSVGRMNLILATTNAGNVDVANFRNPNGTVGKINTNGSSTVYNTSSDARLKDVTGSARGLEVINELNPVSYNWKVDGKADEGLIAQEVLDIVPNAVTGSDEEQYYMDYSKLVVHLVAGMKEQQTLIESLTARLEKLEG